jgi:cytochrome b pre-mRNA-processing protein 3
MLNMIRGFFSTKLSREQKVALCLHEEIVRAARRPVLYTHGGVPDTMEGRLDCIALHAFLIFRRMSTKPGWDDIGGALSDEIVADFDRSLREMGVSDYVIGKRVKKTAQMFFSRFDLYWGAVNGADGAPDLDEAFARALIAEGADLPERRAAWTAYFDRQTKALFEQADPDILRGRVVFADPDGVFDACPPAVEQEGSAA